MHSSYNAINGVPTCASEWLLTTVARDAWGFEGYIVSDCDAVANVLSPHHYVQTAAQAAAATLRAGMDVDCSYFVGQHGGEAHRAGLIDAALIDQRLANLFRVRMRLQHFDPPGPLQAVPKSALCSAGAAAVAREGLVQGAVLLKNCAAGRARCAETPRQGQRATLPLRADELRSVAVLGPNANLSEAMAGYYGPGVVCGGRFPSVIDAVRAQLPAGANLSHAAGVPGVLSDDTSLIPAAAALAAAADVTLLVLGTDLSVARENRDAVNLTFSKGQLALVEAVVAAAAAPVVVLTLTAVPLDLTPLLTAPKVGAVLHLGQPSVQLLGVGELLFGARAPAGRAVQTVYPAAYQHMVSPFDFNMRPGASRWPRPDSPGPCAEYAGLALEPQTGRSPPTPLRCSHVRARRRDSPYKTPVTPSANCTLGTNPGRTYRFYNGSAVVPFGFGLSYTRFAYAVASAPPTMSLARVRQLLQPRQETPEEGAPAADDDATDAAAVRPRPLEAAFPPLADDVPAFALVVNVTNTGEVDADDVVLGFIAPPGAGTGGLPRKTLFDFQRVHVRAGQTVSVRLYPPLSAFAPVAADGTHQPLAGRHLLSVGVPETAPRMGYVESVVIATFD